MLEAPPEPSRELRRIELAADLVVVGGGLAGTCAAIAAARLGLRIVLIQDRPLLGGNSSSEVRLWVLGATAHMASNNRWAREGGIVNELMLENLWRNREGNPVLWDAILLEKAVREPTLTVLLNTACYACDKDPDLPDRIKSVTAFCPQSSTRYVASAPLFCDASGDGILGFLAGAAFRMGAEPREEFGEAFARDDEFGHLLGHSIYFYTKDAGVPVPFVAPSFALKDVEKRIPRYRHFNVSEQGCLLWWIEWGGRMDTVHDAEAIKWELWRVVYGVWDYIKNSGRFPEAANLTLEWVGAISGKRESRRFEGDYMLSQKDIVERRLHEDAIAFGGWSIDLHPADGIYAQIDGSHHLHSKGIYQIPYRCLYSRNLGNLFLAGRIISTSHVAFGSTRVMATCGQGGQAVGVAAALCARLGLRPRDLASGEPLLRLRRGVLRMGGHVPGVPLADPDDLAPRAAISSSSEWVLREIPADAAPVPLDRARAQMLPLAAGPAPRFTVTLDAAEAAEVVAELRTSGDLRHHTPDVLLSECRLRLPAGARQRVELALPATLREAGYGFLVLRPAAGVAWHTSALRITGLLSLYRSEAVDYRAEGGEAFEFFRPERRPGGRNLAVRCDPPLRPYGPGGVTSGFHRPTDRPNAWVAAGDDLSPRLSLDWPEAQTVGEVVIGFDADYDHSLESVLLGHPERAVPFCVRRCRIATAEGRLLREIAENHQAFVRVRLDEPVRTVGLRIDVLGTHGAPAAIAAVRVYRGSSSDI